jgi:hypothetical protein
VRKSLPVTKSLHGLTYVELKKVKVIEWWLLRGEGDREILVKG